LLEPLPSDNGDEADVTDIPDPASLALDETWERDWELNLMQAATERVKRRASPAQFQIFEYHVLQDHTVGETARALGISSARVYLAKHRVLAQVRKEVAYLRTKYV
jgi:RNA polymerase sigma-70 factor (ECF subfamily)